MLKNKYVYLLILILLIILLHSSYFIYSALFYKHYYGLKTGKNILNYCYIYNEIFNNGDYDYDLDLNNCEILDIGSNMGIYMLWLNEKFSNIKVHSFEPINELNDIAEYNINKIKKNNNKFIINPYGLSNKVSRTNITYFPYVNGSSTMYNMQEKNNHLNYFKKSIMNSLIQYRETKNIKLNTIKNYIYANNISHIDLCKIDVEGAELEIMEGFEHYIDLVKYYIIEIENFRHDYLNKIKNLLTNYEIQVNNPHESWVILFAKRKQETNFAFCYL